MIESQFINEFRTLHEKARRGLLDESERQAYLGAREQFAKVLLKAQGLMLEGPEARRHYRVALSLPVELQMNYGNLWTHTQDISYGGFSVIVPHPVEQEERPDVVLELPDGTALAGRVRVVSQFMKHEKHRASFNFLDLTQRELDLLEIALIDFALEGVKTTQQ